MPRQNSQISQPFRARGKHLDLNHYFRLGLIDIFQELACNRQFIRCIADDNCILRIELLHLGQVEHLPKSICNFRQILGLNGIGEVKSLHQLLVIILVLLRGVLRDKNNVFRDRLPEGLALHADDVQRLLKSQIVQIHADAAGREVWIVGHRQSRKLSNGVEDDFNIVDHFQIDGRV